MDRVLVQALRMRGIDVQTALEAEMIERSDADHLAYSSSEGRVLFTCNVGDFCRLHKEHSDGDTLHADIVVEPWQLRPAGDQLRALLKLANTVSAE